MLARFVTLAVLSATAAAPLATPAEPNQLDASPGVFSVVAALNAAGMDYGMSSSSPLRQAVRKELAAREIPVLAELKRFVRDHRKGDPAADLAQYISFALSTSGPPDFQTRFMDNEIPPDVGALEGFAGLMIRFHREANIDDLWKRSQAAIETEIARYQPVASRSVLEVHGYLRAPTSGYMGRRFQIYIDPLGPASQVHTRSYKDDYFLVLSPAAEPQAQEIRHAYLHFMLDPLATKFAEAVNKKRGLGDLAQGAPALDESFKTDFLLLTTESLIKAVEARLDKPAARPQIVEQALAEGFILTPYFAEALPLYEKQEQSMRYYFPDLISGIDLKKETRRLDSVQFAERKVERAVAKAPAPAPVQSAGEKQLEEAEGLYAGRELNAAREAYLKLLRMPERNLHARAYYGLARIAALEGKPALADELFRKTLEMSPDPQTLASTELYLGRLVMLQEQPDRDEAAAHFRRAAATDGASAAVKQSAEAELKKMAGAAQ